MNPNSTVQMALAFGDVALKASAILLGGWLVSLALRRASAAARHLAWLGTLTAMLLLPLLILIAPAQPIAVLHEKPPVSAQIVHPVADTSMNAVALDLSSLDSSAATSAAPVAPVLQHRSERTVWQWVALAAVCAWLLGALGVAFHWVFGVRSVRRLKAEAIPLSASLPTMDRVAQPIGLHRAWDLFVSATGRPPAAMTWGIWRPVILLPQESASWTANRLDAVILHELAHVRRLDCASQFIAAATCALYWFNPAVWLAARALRFEAELAADDSVIRGGIRPSDYARELLRMAAELGHRRQPLTHIGVPVMKQSKIENRLNSILDPTPRSRRGITALEALATVGVAGALLLPLATFRAAVVTDPAVSNAAISTAAAGVPMQPTLGIQKSVPDVVASKPTPKAAKKSHRSTLVSRRKVEMPSLSEVVASIALDESVAAVQASQGDDDPKAKADAEKASAEKMARMQADLAKEQWKRAEALAKMGALSKIDADNAKAKAEMAAEKAKMDMMTVRMLARQTEVRSSQKLELKKLAEARAKMMRDMAKVRGPKVREMLAEQQKMALAQVQAAMKAQRDSLRAQQDMSQHSGADSLNEAKKMLERARRAEEDSRRQYSNGVLSKAEMQRVNAALKMAQEQLELVQKLLNGVHS